MITRRHGTCSANATCLHKFQLPIMCCTFRAIILLVDESVISAKIDWFPGLSQYITLKVQVMGSWNFAGAIILETCGCWKINLSHFDCIGWASLWESLDVPPTAVPMKQFLKMGLPRSQALRTLLKSATNVNICPLKNLWKKFCIHMFKKMFNAWQHCCATLIIWISFHTHTPVFSF